MSVLFSSEMSAQPPLKWIVAYLLTRIISATVFSGVSGQLDKSIVNGIEIKALAFEYPPVFSLKKLPNGNYSFEGMGYEVLSWIVEYFNLTLKYIVVDKNEMQKYGTFDGLIRQMEKMHADVAPMTFEASLENFERISFSQPYWVHNFYLLQPWPKEENRITAPIRPFTNTVWLLFLSTVVAFIGTVSMFARLKGYPNRRSSVWDTIYDQFEYVATIVTSQGNYTPYSARPSFRIIIAAWLLSMVVIVYAYTGLLTAMITVSKLEPIVNTLDELAASRRFKITKEIHSVITDQFMNATSGAYKILGDQLRHDPKLLFSDNFQMIENVLRYDCAWPSAKLIINYIVNEDIKASGTCRLTIGLKPLPMVSAFHFGFAKGSILAPLTDKYIMPLISSSGLETYAINKYFPPVRRCRVDVKQENVSKPISLQNLFGVFILLVIGLSFSLFIFMVEHIVPKIQHQRNEKKLKENQSRRIAW